MPGIGNGRADPAVLRSALQTVLEVGRAIASSSERGKVTDFARELASRPEVANANAIAEQVARTNGYAIRDVGGRRVAGRSLGAREIEEIGLAGALAAAADFDEANVVETLEGYLAGPEIGRVHVVGIDADLILTAPVQVEQWELTRADAATFSAMSPFPALAAFQRQPLWDPERWSGMALLRRPTDKPPVTGLMFNMPRPYPEWDAWLPLTVLALAQPDVVTMWSEHDVEPGRWGIELMNEVWYNYHTYGPPGEEEDFEQIGASSIGITPANETIFRKQIEAISTYLPADPGPNAKRRELQQYNRIKRASQRLLAAGKHTVGSATPWDEVRAMDSLIHYVVALEALLANNSETAEISRRIAQRAAVVAGTSNSDRLRIEDEIKKVYSLRSKVLHGIADPAAANLETLRNIVRRVLLARLVYDSAPRDSPFEELCDQALLSFEALSALQDLLREFGDLTIPNGYGG